MPSSPSRPSKRPWQSVMVVSDDLPVRCARPVHSGKVRSVYFLSEADSRRLIDEREYRVDANSALALMVISDRLSAFDCLWQAESLAGVPGKGAALNHVSAHWFRSFERAGLPAHHLLETPHPMLWVVRQARPLMVEAIARRYLTGSLWRAYEAGQRRFGSYELEDGLERYSRLPDLWFTPSTKGVMRGIPGIPESDDAPVTLEQVREHYTAFGFHCAADVDACRDALTRGFQVVEEGLAVQGELLVDTKFEFGYANDASGNVEMIYMDEVATPDSSRIWREADWRRGEPREQSKELFREALLNWVPDPQLLLDPVRMAERSRFAQDHRVPDAFFQDLAKTYREQAETIADHPLTVPDRPREELLDLLDREFGLLP